MLPTDELIGQLKLHFPGSSQGGEQDGSPQTMVLKQTAHMHSITPLSLSPFSEVSSSLLIATVDCVERERLFSWTVPIKFFCFAETLLLAPGVSSCNLSIERERLFSWTVATDIKLFCFAEALLLAPGVPSCNFIISTTSPSSLSESILVILVN